MGNICGSSEDEDKGVRAADVPKAPPPEDPPPEEKKEEEYKEEKKEEEEEKKADTFLQTLCDNEGFEGGTWMDYIKAKNPEEIEVREYKGKVFLAGIWGSAMEEAVKAELKGMEGSCGEVRNFLMEFGNEDEHGKPADHTEKKTRKWIGQDKLDRLPVWGPENDWDSEDSSSDQEDKEEKKEDTFLQTLCDNEEFEGSTWEDYIKAKNPEEIELRDYKGKVFLAGVWGSVMEEAVKAELKGMDGACGHVYTFLMQFGNEDEHGKPAERTEKKTRKWIQQDKSNRLPVWGPEEDWDSEDSDW